MNTQKLISAHQSHQVKGDKCYL